jgi:23S rRNA A1618 N6-methylase RlmF
VVRAGDQFAFTMCNPPFFATPEDRQPRPETAFDGADVEMVSAALPDLHVF